MGRLDWANRGINLVYLVGEVKHSLAKVSNGRLYVRTRLVMRVGKRRTFVDIYGKGKIAEVMNLICKTGNIVLVSGEFRNFIADNQNHITSAGVYVNVTRITCLLKHERMKRPSNNILQLLDSLDPIGYFGAKPPKPQRRKEK